MVISASSMTCSGTSPRAADGFLAIRRSGCSRRADELEERRATPREERGEASEVTAQAEAPDDRGCVPQHVCARDQSLHHRQLLRELATARSMPIAPAQETPCCARRARRDRRIPDLSRMAIRRSQRRTCADRLERTKDLAEHRCSPTTSSSTGWQSRWSSSCSRSSDRACTPTLIQPMPTWSQMETARFPSVPSHRPARRTRRRPGFSVVPERR